MSDLWKDQPTPLTEAASYYALEYPGAANDVVDASVAHAIDQRFVSRRPSCLDLFCCAGGAAMGLHRAGFDVTGIDIKHQPRYPFAFVQGNALNADLSRYDFVWASPPCQAHSTLTKLTSRRNNLDLIPETRAKLKAWGGPYIIENVTPKVLQNPVMLCGTNFGLLVARHRYFESNLPLTGHTTCDHRGKSLVTVLTKSCRRIGDMRGPSSHAIGKVAMGVDWMTQFELGEAIPPHFSEYLGRQIVPRLKAANIALSVKNPGNPLQENKAD